MEEDDIEQKQNYLRSEIIDKGFNPEDFMNFLEQQGEGKTDLENWTFEGLQSIVYTFQNQFAPQNNNDEVPPPQDLKEASTFNIIQDNINNNPSNEIKEEIHNIEVPSGIEPEHIDNNSSVEEHPVVRYPEEPDENKIPNSANVSQSNISSVVPSDVNKSAVAPVSNSPLIEKVNCNQVTQGTFTNMDDLSIIVSNPEIVKNGFFSFTYVQYSIETQPINLKVVRKIKDCEWLYEKLLAHFPDCIVPPLPPSPVGLKDESPKKVLYLNFFLNAISKVKLLRSSKFFESFITMPQKEFNLIKTELDKIKPPMIADIKTRNTLEGYVNVSITEEMKNKVKRIDMNNIEKKFDCYTRLNKCFDKLLVQFEEISKTFTELSKEYIELQNNYTEEPTLSNGFKILSDLMVEWCKGYQDQKVFFRDDVKYYFKYMQKELKFAEPLYNKYNSAKSDYISQNNRVNTSTVKKDKDVKTLAEMKERYGYYMNLFYEEFNYMLQRHSERMKNQFIRLSSNKDKFIADYDHFVNLLHLEL